MPHAETELRALQRILDQSATAADGFLKETFDLAGHGLSATQLARYFDRMRGVALATVTATGEPRVAPVGAILHRGAFHVPTAMHAKRVVHIRKRPSVSLTHFTLDEIAVIVHGQAMVVDATDPDVVVLEGLYDDQWWRELNATGAAIWLRIGSERIYTWAARPADYPSSWP